MIVNFHKGVDKRPTLHCLRPDGSDTRAPIQNVFGPLHDLGHFAVETTLGFTGGFFGLLAQGNSIQDFEERLDRSWIGPQGLQAEAIVMALQYELNGALADGDFLEAVRASCTATGVPVPSELDACIHKAICERYRALRAAWDALLPGDTLSLHYP